MMVHKVTLRGYDKENDHVSATQGKVVDQKPPLAYLKKSVPGKHPYILISIVRQNLNLYYIMMLNAIFQSTESMGWRENPLNNVSNKYIIPDYKPVNSMDVVKYYTIYLAQLMGIVLEETDNNYVINYWKYLECAYLFTQQRPMHPQSFWLNARCTYANIV